MEFVDEDRREVEEQNDDVEQQQHQINIQAQPCSGGRKGGVGTVRYRECQKNHAVSIGGHAVDGCGEFMPAGEEGTLDALKCAACGCHRNFHRKEAAGAPALRPAPPPAMYQFPPAFYRPPPPPAYLHHPQPLRQAMPAALGPPSPEQPTRANSGGSGQKRFRTKFSEEQKERMRELAERLGWRIQRHDEAEVQRFCREVGVNRQVLKVWMHNNKNHFPAIANP